MKLYDCWDTIDSGEKQKLDNANIFFSKKYEDFEKMRKNRCIYVADSRGLLPVVVWKKGIFKWGELVTEPFYFNDNENEEDFLNDAMHLLPKYISWIGQTATTANFKAFPSNSQRIPFGNYVVDLTKNEDVLISNLTGKCRNMIRRAERDKIVIVRGGKELLDDYCAVDKETWERSGHYKDLKNLYFYYLDALKENARIYLAKKDAEVQGGSLFIFNNEMSYYMFGASINKPSPGAMNYLQWKAMTDFKKMGVKAHSFVGCRINEDYDSKFHGIQKFKSSFGGMLIQGYMFKKSFNSRSYFLFKKACMIKNHGNNLQGDIIDQEIYKWKTLND